MVTAFYIVASWFVYFGLFRFVANNHEMIESNDEAKSGCATLILFAFMATLAVSTGYIASHYRLVERDVEYPVSKP